MGDDEQSRYRPYSPLPFRGLKDALIFLPPFWIIPLSCGNPETDVLVLVSTGLGRSILVHPKVPNLTGCKITRLAKCGSTALYGQQRDFLLATLLSQMPAVDEHALQTVCRSQNTFSLAQGPILDQHSAFPCPWALHQVQRMPSSVFIAETTGRGKPAVLHPGPIDCTHQYRSVVDREAATAADKTLHRLFGAARLASLGLSYLTRMIAASNSDSTILYALCPLSDMTKRVEKSDHRPS